MSNTNHVTIDGITYKLVEEVAFDDFYDEDDYEDEYDDEEPEREVVENPFAVGNYVTVVTPKRPDHRVGQSGKVVAMTPVELWDDPYTPQVYVEFANSADGCGHAQNRTGQRHGCRMPVTGLTFANGV